MTDHPKIRRAKRVTRGATRFDCSNAVERGPVEMRPILPLSISIGSSVCLDAKPPC